MTFNEIEAVIKISQPKKAQEQMDSLQNSIRLSKKNKKHRILKDTSKFFFLSHYNLYIKNRKRSNKKRKF